MSDAAQTGAVAPAPQPDPSTAPARPLVLSLTVPPGAGPELARFDLGNIAPGARIQVVKISYHLRPTFGPEALTLELRDFDERTRCARVILSRDQAKTAQIHLGERLAIRQLGAEGQESHPVELVLAPQEQDDPARFGSSRFLEQSRKKQENLEAMAEAEPVEPPEGEVDQPAFPDGSERPALKLDSPPSPKEEHRPDQKLGRDENGVLSWK